MTRLGLPVLCALQVAVSAEVGAADPRASERMLLAQLFEACRTKALQTGRFPSGYRELEGLLSVSARSRMPASVVFEDPDSGANPLYRKSPLGNRTPCLRLKVGANRWLNVAATGWIYESGDYWMAEFLNLMPRHYMDPALLQKDARSIPERAAPRSPRCGPAQVDLVPSCNAIPTTPWFFGPTMRYSAPAFGNWLQTGIYEYQGLLFDVRGIVQLEGSLVPKEDGKRSLHSFPTQVSAIRVGRAARFLHLLAGTTQKVAPGTSIAILRLHFASGSVEDLSLIYGKHMADPMDSPGDSPRLYPAPGQTEEISSLHYVSLENPRPADEILSLDFQAQPVPSHPFILAITLQP
jgi:hypothetical protein